MRAVQLEHVETGLFAHVHAANEFRLHAIHLGVGHLARRADLVCVRDGGRPGDFPTAIDDRNVRALPRTER